jgi:hypothetical protein
MLFSRPYCDEVFIFLCLKGIIVTDRHRSPSVRSTNVYEERSLGIYADDTSIDEENINLSGDRITVWGNYVAMHARKQLAFGMRSFHDYLVSTAFITTD